MIKLQIKVKPNSSRDEINIDAENNLSIKIRAKPIDGEANDYLVKYLAKELGISRGVIQIEKGATGRHKRIAINIAPALFEQLIKKFRK